MSLLICKNIYKSYGKTVVLNGLNFKLEEGEIVSLLGSSGSGKSTLLRLIAGFENVDSGEIFLRNKPVSNKKNFLPAHKRSIGFVFQDLGLFPHLSVEKNIAFGLSKPNPIFIKQLLSIFEISDQKYKFPHELSGGQQQRVALARAIAPKPHLICFDEPFSSLDPLLKERLLPKLKSLLLNEFISAIIVTHSIEEAEKISDKIFEFEKLSV